MNTLRPSVTQVLLKSAAREFQPSFVNEGAELVRARHPDHHRCCIRHRAKPRLALYQRTFGTPPPDQVRQQEGNNRGLNEHDHGHGNNPGLILLPRRRLRNSTVLPGGRRFSLIFQRRNSRQSYRAPDWRIIFGGKFVAGLPRKIWPAIRADSWPSRSSEYIRPPTIPWPS